MAQHIEQTYKDGDWKGFKFTVKQFDSTAEAVDSIGEDNILSLVNQQFASRIRAKVKNSLPKGLIGEDLTAAQQPKGVGINEKKVKYSFLLVLS